MDDTDRIVAIFIVVKDGRVYGSSVRSFKPCGKTNVG
jgi:hypothetical protein